MKLNECWVRLILHSLSLSLSPPPSLSPSLPLPPHLRVRPLGRATVVTLPSSRPTVGLSGTSFSGARALECAGGQRTTQTRARATLRRHATPLSSITFSSLSLSLALSVSLSLSLSVPQWVRVPPPLPGPELEKGRVEGQVHPSASGQGSRGVCAGLHFHPPVAGH